MQKKRILSLILSAVLLFALCVPVCANSEPSVDEVNRAMDTVANSVLSLGDTASSGEAGSIAGAFHCFLDVVRTGGQILTAVNGSVTFLRLIGVITDPTQAKLDGILSQLQTIDERLASMDDKLDNLTTAMTEIKASVEFNARAEKAILYKGSWRDFEYRYVENGMDKLVTQYNSMLRTGLMSWCNGSRNESNVDNSRIIVLYRNGQLTFSDSNGIPSDITDQDSWVVLPADVLPSSFSYDVNTFHAGLVDDIAGRISDALKQGNYGLFETQNYPLLSEGSGITDADIRSLATDAVDTLVFRVASAKVNGDSSFAGEVSRQFSNYCNHLQTSGDGLDATLKTFYLTHAFEYSVADDLRDFCDRMIILTGTYGMFAANVLGMSHLTTDSEKLSAVSQMTSAINMAREAKENGITGDGSYCYITGTRLQYASVTFSASAEIQAHYTMSNTTYQSCKGTAPAAAYSADADSSAVPAGDTAMIVLMNTLRSNGITPDHAYLNENIGGGAVADYGKVVTGYSSPQTLSFDGKTKLHVRNTFGDYFSDNSEITSLPEDAEPEYVAFRKKISGSVYDLATGTLTSNTTLSAIAAYGENHMYWITDEGAFMGGPADASSFKDSYSVEKTGADSSGPIRTHSYSTSTSYNILLSVPSGNLTAGGYSPLNSLNAEIEPCTYDASLYESEEDEEPVGLRLGASQADSEAEKVVGTVLESPDIRTAPDEAAAIEAPTDTQTGVNTTVCIVIAAAVVILALWTAMKTKKKKQ